MSRIIHKRMTVTIEPSDVEVAIKIYAMSYNILHIQSGLAGLKF
jgi:hypothetical protein